jgi:Dockerin type I domain/PEP-CTERM motif
MSRHSRLIFPALVLLAAVVPGGGSALGQISTGNFVSPSTTAFLSVDMNGGSWSANDAQSPTEGWDQNNSDPQISPDQYGVTWTPWGGPTYDGGDGIQLPTNQSGTSLSPSSNITKTFSGISTSNVSSGAITATLSAPGEAAAYTPNGTGNINSRDWGDGFAQGATGPAFDIDMWRDFVTGQSSYADVQSTNFLQLQLSGLNPNSKYTVDLFSYNEYYTVPTAATAMPPIEVNYVGFGWWNPASPGQKQFTAPADEQVQNPATGGGSLAAPAALTVITNGQGTGYVWLWGGSGNTGDQNGTDTDLNGFQIGGGTSVLLGDTNGDGIVNSADLATLQANMGQTFTGIYSRGYSIGDFNGDGVVNTDDFALFQLGVAEYNSTHTSLAVPEPTSMALIGLAAAILRRDRRK